MTASWLAEDNTIRADFTLAHKFLWRGFGPKEWPGIFAYLGNVYHRKSSIDDPNTLNDFSVKFPAFLFSVGSPLRDNQFNSRSPAMLSPRNRDLPRIKPLRTVMRSAFRNELTIHSGFIGSTCWRRQHKSHVTVLRDIPERRIYQKNPSSFATAICSESQSYTDWRDWKRIHNALSTYAAIRNWIIASPFCLSACCEREPFIGIPDMIIGVKKR
jgi:hypothetical protein